MLGLYNASECAERDQPQALLLHQARPRSILASIVSRVSAERLSCSRRLNVGSWTNRSHSTSTTWQASITKEEPIVPVVHRDGREAAVSPDVAFTNTKLLQLLACLKSRSGPFITNC